MRTLISAISMALMTAATGAIELNTMVQSVDGATQCWRGTAAGQRIGQVDVSLRYDRDTINDHDNFYSFALRALRPEGTAATAQGYCADQDGGSVQCMVECDGGSITLRQHDGSPLALSVEPGRFLRLSEDCNGASFDLLPEDGILYAEPADTALCTAVRDPDWVNPAID